jgi:hypothetical protein
MIANFFQNLDAHGVESLLISGQAAVLYGAATFSEDIDLWINPTPANRDTFLSALRVCGARYYKLTPEFTVEYLVRGHGFHFVLPGSGRDEIFLDIMGAPPRLGSFAEAVTAAKWIRTEWGRLHTVGIKDLVELKKTQRLEDYAIIGKLALAWFDQSECANSPEDFQWAVENMFTLTELRIFFEERPAAGQSPLTAAPAAFKEFARQMRATGDVTDSVEKEVSDWMQQRMTALQQADRRYWRGLIAELKELRSAGKLMPEGAGVCVQA